MGQPDPSQQCPSSSFTPTRASNFWTGHGNSIHYRIPSLSILILALEPSKGLRDEVSAAR